MNENDLKIVRVTNISDFDFTGELGARYNGRDFVIQAGKSLLVPFAVGNHLATHLARQIVIQKSPIRDESEINGKGSDRPLWNDSTIDELRKKIMVDVYEEEVQVQESDADKLARRVEELNKLSEEDDDVLNVDTLEIKPTDPEKSGVIYKDKAQIIAELKKREVKFNARDTKANLEKLLR